LIRHIPTAAAIIDPAYTGEIAHKKPIQKSCQNVDILGYLTLFSH